MTTSDKNNQSGTAADLLLPSDVRRKSVPISLVREDHIKKDIGALTPVQRSWLTATGFTGRARTFSALPGESGAIDGIVFGIGSKTSEHNYDPKERLLGWLPAMLPAGVYHLDDVASDLAFDMELAATAWGLGGYRFERYKTQKGLEQPVLKAPKGVNHERVVAALDAVWLGRDLINTPAGDMGPDDLELAARMLAKSHGAKLTCIKGEELLAKNFPLIHAVGRASPRAPRLIDLTWDKSGTAKAPAVTLVGKGICFDTGGLDIKPASGMLIMKKDMGGAAAVLSLAHMIMALKLPVRLRVLIPAAENSIAGDAFRPGDIIKSRAGLTVEIGNTDAEGRLVLADALTLADETKPDYLMSFATLTGAARVAMGPDVPPFFTNDDAFAQRLQDAGQRQCDPLWRLPFWSDYERMLESPIADINNVGAGGFAGSITAALFLRRFVRHSVRYAHFDIYGWRPEPGALGPKGGEPHAVRAVFAALRAILTA